MKCFDLFGVMVAEKSNWGLQLIDGLKPVLYYIFLAIGSVAIIYATYLAFNLAKAADEAKRSAAKKRIINVIAGLLIVVILTVVMIAWDTSEAKKFSDYTLNTYSFGVEDFSGDTSKKVYLVKNDIVQEKDMIFEQITNTTNITIDAFGTVKANQAGYIEINVYFESGLTKEKFQNMTESERADILKLSKEKITIRKYLAPGQVDTGINETTGAMNWWCPVDYGPTGAGADGNFHGRPLLPHISSYFGGRDKFSTSGGTGSTNHRGVDMRLMPVGQMLTRNIYAAAIGVVKTKKKDGSASGGYGNYIVVEHDVGGEKYYTTYGHLNDWAPGLTEGSIVGGMPGDTYNGKATAFPYGKEIGYMGTTGNSSGIHLHFEIHTMVNSTKYQINPLNGSDYWDGKAYVSVLKFPTFFSAG